MKNLRQFVLVALVGLLVGAALDEALHRVRERNHTGTFGQKLHCRDLADAYAKKESGDNVSVFVEKVDFSDKRSSCVAAINRGMSGSGHASWEYDAVDLITGEQLFHGACGDLPADPNFWCSNGRDIKLMESRDKALEAALSKP